MNHNAHKKWTKPETEKLTKLYPTTCNKELAALFGRTIPSIRAKANKLDVDTTEECLANSSRKNTQVKKGQTPWNKGLAGWDAGGRSHKTRCKKGERRGRANRIYQPIGATRISKEGHLQIKVNDDMPFHRRWQSYHRIVWEKHNGPIPKGHVIRFKDGMLTTEKEEITIDKLECISMAENMRRNTIHKYPREIALAVQMRAALNRRINHDKKHQ